MKKNEKGFTLIELLAVIVILAVIALIATPIVMNVINKSRQKAAEDSAYGVFEAVRAYHTERMLDTSTDVSDTLTVTFTNGTPSEANLKIGGTKPKSGTVTINDDGSISIPNDKPLIINGYRCTGSDATKVVCSNNAS